MGEFLGFMLIVFFFFWGSAILLPYVRRKNRNLEGPVDNEVLARLLEDVDQLSSRLTRVEEEMDFFKDLNAPREPGSLPPAGAEEEGE